MGGTVNCSNCGSAWSKPDGVNFGIIRINRCPNCGVEVKIDPDPTAGPLPWGIPPPGGADAPPAEATPKPLIETISNEEHAVLDGENVDWSGLVQVVREAEKDWNLTERINLGWRVQQAQEEAKKRRQRRG